MFLNHTGNGTKICISHVNFNVSPDENVIFHLWSSSVFVFFLFLVPNPHRTHVHRMFFSTLNEHVTSKNVWFLRVNFMHFSAKAVLSLNMSIHFLLFGNIPLYCSSMHLVSSLLEGYRGAGVLQSLGDRQGLVPSTGCQTTAHNNTVTQFYSAARET